MPTRRSQTPQPAKPSSVRNAVLGVTVVAIAVATWLIFGRGPNFADEAVSLQRRLLSLDVSPQEHKAMLTTLMRHVDKLDSDDQRELLETVRQEWRDIQRQDMDAYFAADDADRQSALDRSLDRLELISELYSAFIPGGMRVRKPRPRGDAAQTPNRRPPAVRPDASAQADRRKALESYLSALEKRARERGIDFNGARRILQRG